MVIGSENDPTSRPKIHPKMGMGPGVKIINRPMKKLKTESFPFGLHHLQIPFIMLVQKLVLFANIKVNTHHGLIIHSLFCILHTVCVELAKHKLIPIYGKV
jgi:hypothetical protein